MGRGLSQLQRDILGLAYAVNAYTQNGINAVKHGKGPSDIKSSLAIYALKDIAPSEYSTGFFHGSKEYKSAKATVNRAVTRLVDRGLLMPTSPEWNRLRLFQWGYVLMADGFVIAKGIECNPPCLADAVELFGIKAGKTFEAEKRNQLMESLTYLEWIYGSFIYPLDERRKLINRLQGASQ